MTNVLAVSFSHKYVKTYYQIRPIVQANTS